MNTNEITLAKSWELISKEDNNSKDINWQDTQQVMDTFGLSNWNVSFKLNPDYEFVHVFISTLTLPLRVTSVSAWFKIMP